MYHKPNFVKPKMINTNRTTRGDTSMLMKTPYLTASELGIDEKIHTALLEVKRQLETGFIEPGQFCMGIVRVHPMECGTIACIGGWVGINMNLGVEATHRMVASASGSIRKLYFPDEIRSYHAMMLT